MDAERAAATGAAIGAATVAGWPLLASIVAAAALVDGVITHHPVQFASTTSSTPAFVSKTAAAPTPGNDVLDERGAVLVDSGLITSVVPPMLASAALVVGMYATVQGALALARTAERFEASCALDRAWRSTDPLNQLHDALTRPEQVFMPLEDFMHVIGACVAATLASGGVGAWIVMKSRQHKSVGRRHVRIANAIAWTVVFVLVALGSVS